MKRAVFFDRDGTVNECPGAGYVLRWEDFRFRPGVTGMLRRVREAGWLAILVTSQQCVGKGLLSPEALAAIHHRMQQALGPLAFDDVYVCPHLEGTCECRKPSPRLLLDAAGQHGLDLSRCWNIGDRRRDMEMGRRAGVGVNILLGSPPYQGWREVSARWAETVGPA